jgi:hypothetical protein
VAIPEAVAPLRLHQSQLPSLKGSNLDCLTRNLPGKIMLDVSDETSLIE